MIQFYGAPNSSAGRTHLVLEEAGVPYEYHQVKLRDATARAEYLKVNPLGKVPFIIDGDLRLHESIAIDFYLCERYAPALWSSDAADRARIYAWSLFAIATVQPECARVMRHAMMLPAEQRVPLEVEQGKALCQRHLDELELALPASGYFVGGKLSVADLHVASTVNLVAAFGAMIDGLGPRVSAWLAGIKARPAWQKIATVR
jgi:glutathione S-transferase